MEYKFMNTLSSDIVMMLICFAVTLVGVCVTIIIFNGQTMDINIKTKLIEFTAKIKK